MSGRISAFILSIIFISGCVTRPSITYYKIDEKHPVTSQLELTDSYFLNASRITISPSTEKNDKGQIVIQYNITSDPIEYQEFKVGVRASNNLIKTTKLNITKADNSDRFASGGTETTDNLKTLVSTVGGIIVKGAGLVGGSGPAPAAVEPENCIFSLPTAVNFEIPKLSNNAAGTEISLTFDDKNPSTSCIKIKIGALPPDARKIADYPWGTTSSEYFYSACRNLSITLTSGDKRTITKNVRVADPEFYQSVQYPYKGAVSMHTQCGVSVKTDAQANPFAGMDTFAELLKQLEAIKNTNK